MVRRKSHPGTNGNKSALTAVNPVLKPIYTALEHLKENLHTYSENGKVSFKICASNDFNCFFYFLFTPCSKSTSV